MRNSLRTAAVSLLLATTGLATVTLPAAAQMSDEEDRRRSNQTLTTRVGGQLAEAYNMINEEPPRLREALNILNGLAGRETPDYDRATVLEIRAIVRYQLDDINGAISDYAEVLRLDVLNRERESNIRRTIASLYYQQERFDETIRFMTEYIDGSGGEATANDYFILAGAYYQKGDYRNARRPAERTIELDDQRKKQYYDFLNSIYNELNLQAERGELLETMVEYFPNEASYWEQLSGSYSQAGREQDAFSTLWAAYRAGLLSEEDKIIALAQYYYQLDNPYPGAVMLSREMEAGNVRRNLNNLKLLSQLWAAAREQDRAIAILTEAAPQSGSGDLYYQLGQSYSADEQWQEAINALRQALAKGGLDGRDQGQIYLLIGNAYQGIDDESAEGRRRALEAYQQATRFSSSRAQAQAYINYIRQVQQVECQQDEVERLQLVDSKKREIDRCEGYVELVELGGSVDIPEEDLARCRTLLSQVEAGRTAEELVRAEEGALDRTQCRGA